MRQPISETLANGLTVVVVPAPEAHQVQVSLLLAVGSRFESPAELGCSHFLEHMLFRGSKAHPSSQALALAFEGVGTLPGAMTGVESTEFDFVAHPERLEEALTILTGFVREPLLLDLEKERAIIQDEIQYDYNEQGELIHLGSIIAGMLWPHHPLGQSIIGTSQTLERQNETSLRAYHARHYQPQNMILGLVGRITPEEALPLVRRTLGEWKGTGHRELPELVTGRLGAPGARVHTAKDSDSQLHVQLSFPAPGYNDPEEGALVLLSRLLDDGPTTRLQLAVREESGLAYHVAADYSGFQDVGQFDITTSLTADRLVDGLTAMMTVLRDFREHGPKEDELARAKRRHQFELEFARDDLRTAMERHVWPRLYSTPRDEAEELAMIEAVTSNQLQALAARILRRDTACLAMVGPVDEAAQAALHAALELL